jgi:hypothetical protein
MLLTPVQRFAVLLLMVCHMMHLLLVLGAIAPSIFLQGYAVGAP